MNPFQFAPVASAEQALVEMAQAPPGRSRFDTARFIAGGTNLLDLMKENVQQPVKLVDINALALQRIEPSASGGLLLGALARNADTAYDPVVRERYPLLSAAILAGASPQIRNMASNGGNLLQRTRCLYFYDTATPCNKREPGAGCSAIGGLTRLHAILGASAHCIATHPSDMCVALAALGAVVHVQSASGSREVPMHDFHRLPGDQPDIDTTLAPDELITHIELPDLDHLRAHSTYLKLRDRASYAFALVSVGAALALDADHTIRDARVALGGVAHKPWRRPEAEAWLIGQPAAEPQFEAFAERLLQGAQGQGDNDFKIVMARRAIVRALQMAVAGQLNNTGVVP